VAEEETANRIQGSYDHRDFEVQIVCILNSILFVILADVCWNKMYNWRRLISRPNQRREPRHGARDTNHLFLVDRLFRIRFSDPKDPDDQ
jgi:hypothetical protein